jgi:hypothetical protein
MGWTGRVLIKKSAMVFNAFIGGPMLMLWAD